MVDIVGIIDEIDNTYVILLIKEKSQIQPPSYVKTRSSHMQNSESKKEEKDKKEILAIGLLRKVNTHEHNLNQLKEIERKY